MIERLVSQAAATQAAATERLLMESDHVIVQDPWGHSVRYDIPTWRRHPILRWRIERIRAGR